MDQPIILCGLGRVGWRVLEYLQTAGLPVVVIDTNASPADTRLAGVRVVRGDCRRPETLQEAGLATARAVLIVTSDDLVNISATMMARHLNPGVRIVMRMFNQNLLTRLGKAVNNVFALSTSTLAAPVLALTALTGQALGTFRIEGLGDGEDAPLRTMPGHPAGHGRGARQQVTELLVGAGHSLRGQTVGQAAALHDLYVLAHFPAEQADRYLLDVDPGAPLEPGDRLVVCGDPHQLEPLLQQGDEGHAGPLRGGALRRLGRMAWRTLAEIDLPVKICTGILLGVVVTSTLVFHLAMERQTVADALYRTISLIATGADMRIDDRQLPGLKVFVSVLRILGAALTAAFTAIVTNYLLRARLGAALEIRRVPDAGHVIVCGLGNVGYRVVEELLGYGERVVVLEMARDSRFVTTVRRLGVAVIHGDATVREVLRQANAATARAVIAATSNDLANLEVALLTRELNDQQRVVLRLHDPHLAQTLREAARVRFGLSVPALAAPAFVAALFGDRVLSVFLVRDRLLAVVDLVIGPQDTHLIGQTVRVMAVDYRFLPVTVLGPDGTPHKPMLAYRLTAGCRVVAVVALSDLERCVHRQPVPGDCTVEVTSFTLPAREWLALLLRTQKGLSAEEAEQELERMPVCVGSKLTRGQAEDLLAVLTRERVACRLRREEDGPAAATPLDTAELHFPQ
jgi:Trk K+ transport system NAD-binding subunit